MSSLEWLLCVAVALLLTGSTVFARENISHQSTVDELLQLDSQAALLTAKKNIFGVTQQLHVGSDADVGRADGNQVLAIYGVGKMLTAEVLLESEPYVFKRSHARPLWGSSLQYRLERISPPCVHLKKAGQAQVICLRKTP